MGDLPGPQPWSGSKYITLMSALKTAFLFPGQGSQRVGMMSALATDFELVQATFAEASAVLKYDLWSIVTEGPGEQLNKTEITQPAILVAGIATWRVWQDLGGSQPDFFAGHSLGEYSALVAAGVMSFPQAVSIVAERGRLMQAAVAEGAGAMAAVLGLKEHVLIEICERAAGDGIVACANFNAPGQVVISGDRKAVERAGEMAKLAGARRVLPLPVSVPSHCLLMRGAATKLQATLRGVHFAEGSVPVIQNTDARAYTNADQIRAALARQLWQPVRWTETIAALLDAGVSRFVECGPGKVLAGLNRRISKESTIFTLINKVCLNQAMDTGEVNDHQRG